MLIIMVIIVLAVLYEAEVLLGSSPSVHNSELGEIPGLEQRKKFPKTIFFGKFAPLLILLMGLLILPQSPKEGFALLATSVVIFAWHYSKNRNRGN